MPTETLIAVRKFCQIHNLEISFVDDLCEYGLIEIARVEEENYFQPDQLPALEKFVRLHTELGINMEGIDAIHHLLDRIENMQSEISQLNNRLRHFGSI